MKNSEQESNKILFGLSLGALGVVFGDIGTSPLYAVNQIFFGNGQMPVNWLNVVGCISLILYTLTIIVGVKYVVFVLRADNDSQGGVFALLSLLGRDNVKKNSKAILFITTFLMLAAGLLFGDGLITPAISVLSAVEGLKVATPQFQNYVVPITIVLLTLLFGVQFKGTAKVGRLFGPILLVWFTVIAILGARQIYLHPQILNAFNPYYAVYFLGHIGIEKILVVLGFVMLSITGGEALYADMGHFGKKPIRLSWFAVVFPALILCYLGQGALLIGGATVSGGNIFFSMVPTQFLYPMVILATMSTIIASQALISGGFSLATQASALGYFPRVAKIHTDKHHEGQTYVPLVNWSLFIGCVVLVLSFKSSDALASAYGLAVSGDMLATSLAMVAISYYVWQWQLWKAVGLFATLAMVDSTFLIANSIKFFEGGFIPFSIGVVIFTLITIWRWGRKHTAMAYENIRQLKIKDFSEILKQPTSTFHKSVVFMTADYIESVNDLAPEILQTFWNRFKILPKDIILLNVVTEKQPYLYEQRFEIHNLYDEGLEGATLTSVRVKFGFLEDPNVEKVLIDLANEDRIHIAHNPEDWLIYIVQERILPNKEKLPWYKNLRLFIYQFLLRNSDSADHYFGLGNSLGLSTEIIPVRIE